MRHRIFVALFSLLALAALCARPVAVDASELVLFEQAACPWCEQWREEVGETFPLTDEGQRLGFRAVDIHAKRPDDLVSVGPVRFTPTFVVMDGAREVGRIVGYPGEDMFYAYLQEIIEKLDHKGL